ncbi:MAG: RidA family protein [Balneolales bacterium]
MISKKIIQTFKAPEAIGPYSQAIVYGDTLFCSGQIGLDPTTGKMVVGGLEAQVNQVMQNLEAILQEAGIGFDHVLKCSLFLDDMAHFQKVNEIYSTFFVTNKPARETMAVKSLPKGAMIEISCIAHM